MQANSLINAAIADFSLSKLGVVVVDENRCPMPAGQIGELCVRGGNVMMGYWNHPEETAQVFRQG